MIWGFRDSNYWSNYNYAKITPIPYLINHSF